MKPTAVDPRTQITTALMTGGTSLLAILMSAPGGVTKSFVQADRRRRGDIERLGAGRGGNGDPQVRLVQRLCAQAFAFAAEDPAHPAGEIRIPHGNSLFRNGAQQLSAESA